MEKRVVVHVDDIGSSISANRAAFSLLQNGYATSGSIMVPGNGFPDIVKQTSKIQNIDLGIHITLTSERPDEQMKRKPTLPRYEVPSLVDNDGYFWPNVDDVLCKASSEEIKKEAMNQIVIAQEKGIDITHLDSHMGVLLHKKLFPIYQELATVFNIQPFIVKSKPGDGKGNRFYGCDSYIDDLIDSGFKLFDHFEANSLYHGEKDYNAHCIDRINSLKGGATYFLLHVLGDNINDIEKTTDFIARQKEYHFFRSDVANKVFEEQHIKKVTMKEL